MALTGSNDEQVALGAAAGGGASLAGPAIAATVKTVAIKAGIGGAIKTGLGIGLSLNPIVAGAALLGGVAYLIGKHIK